jgi:hypothetical protein
LWLTRAVDLLSNEATCLKTFSLPHANLLYEIHIAKIELFTRPVY